MKKKTTKTAPVKKTVVAKKATKKKSNPIVHVPKRKYTKKAPANKPEDKPRLEEGIIQQLAAGGRVKIYESPLSWTMQAETFSETTARMIEEKQILNSLRENVKEQLKKDVSKGWSLVHLDLSSIDAKSVVTIKSGILYFLVKEKFRIRSMSGMDGCATMVRIEVAW